MTRTLSINYGQWLQRLEMPSRLLLGPGPSNVHPAVLQAMNTPPVGHLDPAFLALMKFGRCCAMWQTENPLTIAVSGTGTAAMEATIANATEHDDVVLVGVSGYFGTPRGYGGTIWCGCANPDKTLGTSLHAGGTPERIRKASSAILALVHAETSTGRQPLDGVGDLCREFGCLLLVDTVTSLGGVPLFLDAWGVDFPIAVARKGCLPVLLLTIGPRAMEKLQQRRTKLPTGISICQSKYWGSERYLSPHSPINLYMREGLRLVAEEGLAKCWQRINRM